MKRRERVLKKLGGKCIRCGSTHRLHLHHVYYSKDSARWVEGEHDPYNAREKEADLNPDRFQLYCVTCHGDYHSEQRIKQQIKDGLDPLSILHPKKYRVLRPCKICNWPYFPEELQKHEETCNGEDPLERNRKKLLNS